MNPYQTCPTIDGEGFTLRLLKESDADELFACYSDPAAVMLMNDDNCDCGFYFDTREKLNAEVKFWLDSYSRGEFIRLSIIEKSSGAAVGTVEAFVAECGILRLDIESRFETEICLKELFDMSRRFFVQAFGCSGIVTKAIGQAAARRATLLSLGWEDIGRFRVYDHYFKYTDAR